MPEEENNNHEYPVRVKSGETLRIRNQEFKEDPTMGYAWNWKFIEKLKTQLAITMAFSFVFMIFGGIFHHQGSNEVAWLMLGSYLGLFWVPALIYGLIDRAEKTEKGKIKKVETVDD